MAVISKALSVIVWTFSIFFLPHIDMLRFTFVPPAPGAVRETSLCLSGA